MARQVGPKNVVGRDKLIETIWKKLDTQSLLFTAERRVGKTTVMTKMATEPKAGYEVLFMDLEGIDSPTRFVELVINRALPLLSAASKMKKWWDDPLLRMVGLNDRSWIELDHRVGSKKTSLFREASGSNYSLVFRWERYL